MKYPKITLSNKAKLSLIILLMAMVGQSAWGCRPNLNEQANGYEGVECLIEGLSVVH